MDCSTPGFPVHRLLEFAQTHVHWISNAIQPSLPLLSPSPPALIFPSIKAFSNELALCNRWSEYWSFSFSISPSNEYSGLISFRKSNLFLMGLKSCLVTEQLWSSNELGLYNVCVCVQSCAALHDPMDCGWPGFSVHGIFQAGMLEWVAISYSRASSWLGDPTRVSCASYIGRWILHRWQCYVNHNGVYQHNRANL